MSVYNFKASLKWLSEILLSLCGTLYSGSEQCKSLPNFDKACVKMLLKSWSVRKGESLYLKYAVCKASDLSATRTCKIYGYHNMAKTISKVEEAIVETESIMEAMNLLVSKKGQC